MTGKVTPPPFSEVLEFKIASNREDSWRVQDMWNNWILGNHSFFCIACYFKMLKRTSEDNSSYESVFFLGRPRLSSASPFATRLTSSMSRRKKAACGHHSQSQHCTHSHSHSDFFSSSPFSLFLVQTISFRLFHVLHTWMIWRKWTTRYEFMLDWMYSL